MATRAAHVPDEVMLDTDGPHIPNVDGLNLECHKEREPVETSLVPYQLETIRNRDKSILPNVWFSLRSALHACQNPMWWILSIYIAWLALANTKSMIQDTGMLEELKGYFHHTPRSTSRDTFSPDYPKLIALQSQLQRAMETSTNTLGVAIDLKRSEVAVRDLVTLVKQSDLVSKERLIGNLQQFVEDAKSTGRSLQKFGNHVGTAVDQTIGINEYTIGLLESAAKPVGRSTSLKTLSSALELEEIKSAWFEAIGSLKSNVGKLIVEATANEQALNRLDGELSVINDMSTREDRRLNRDKAETLNQLWTFLGGNKGQLAHFEHHSELLKNVLNYRKAAADHVNGALFQLQRLELDLQNLNDRVAEPLLQKDAQVPLEVYIRTMQQGTARLLEARAREREREDGYARKAMDG